MKVKKNKAMRLASVLFVLTLLTSCMTAGTFAKYTAKSEATATARVAKFGVDIEVNAETLFGEKYKSAGEVASDTDTGITVSASEMVVAPGTKGSMTFTVSGNAETKVAVTAAMENIQEVKLTTGTYKDTNTQKEVTLAADYYPVVWKLSKAGGTALVEGKLSDIEGYFTSFSKEINANENLADQFGTYTLSWEWKVDANDSADTLLGMLSADPTKVEKRDSGSNFVAVTPADYHVTEAFKFSISVTQVD